jgi:hypothetical protein
MGSKGYLFTQIVKPLQNMILCANKRSNYASLYKILKVTKGIELSPTKWQALASKHESYREMPLENNLTPKYKTMRGS